MDPNAEIRNRVPASGEGETMLKTLGAIVVRAEVDLDGTPGNIVLK